MSEVSDLEVRIEFNRVLKEFKDSPEKPYLYFTTENGYVLCVSCAKKEMQALSQSPDLPTESHINYDNTTLVCHSCNRRLKYKKQAKADEAEYVGTLLRVREIFTEMGFIASGLGVWKFSQTLSPGNTIEVCTFTHGDFWVNIGNRTVHRGNYKSLLMKSFIKILLEVIDKT